MTTSTTVPVSSWAPFRRAHLLLALLVPAAVLGFWKTYLGRLDALPETMTALTHLHAALMFLWILLLPAQAWLIRTGHRVAHRRVGLSSWVLVPAIVLLGVGALRQELARASAEELPEVARLDSLAVGMLLAFTTTWALGMRFRRTPGVHVRYMVSTGLAISSAIVWRIFTFWVPPLEAPAAATAANGAVLLLVALALVAADWRRGVRRSPFWVVTAFLAVMHAGYWTYARSEVYLALVSRVLRLQPHSAG